MIPRFLPIWLCLAVLLPGQQSSRQSSMSRVDVNGRSIEGFEYSQMETPSGVHKVETVRSINGRRVPLESMEERVVREDANGRVVERTVRKYDAEGRPGPPEKVHIEERKKPDGSSTVETTIFRGDLNGRLQLAGRIQEETQKSDGIQTKSTVERPTLNGGMEVVERSTSTRRESGAESTTEAVTYRRDANGGFREATRQVSATTKSGDSETTDTTRFEPGANGKLERSGRTISKTRTNPDGSQTEVVDVYSRFLAGHAADANSGQPRLQEQIVRERKPAQGNQIVETTAVRSRLPNDPSRFGNYEQVSESIYTKTGPSGVELKGAETVVNRRDINGKLSVQETRKERSISTKQ